MPHVVFVLGKPPRRETVVAAVIERMRAAGSEIAVHLPNDEAGALPSLLLHADLVVQRGLRHHTLAELAAVEAAGVRCCNPIGACVAVADRVGVGRALAGAGVAVPAGAHRRGVE